MTRWLRSGIRRDLCILLGGAEDGELPAQRLKTRLERHYNDRVEPRTFYGALEDLQRKGFVQSRTEELTDVYSLTDGGRQRLEDHHQWMQDQLE